MLNLSRLVAGNTLTQMLGDFGAEVVKVEPPAWQTKGIATDWKLYARNKKSLCLDLRKQEAKDLLLRLLPSAAIFIQMPAIAQSSARRLLARLDAIDAREAKKFNVS